MEKINIKVSEIFVSNKGLLVETGGVGSCIVVCLFDKEAKIGAMSHSMLPTGKKYAKTDIEIAMSKPGKYVDSAIRNMVKEIEALGGKRDRIKAKIAGGAEMFSYLSNAHINIGKENVQIARDTLKELNIPIAGESIGGSAGRVVGFDLNTFSMNVVVKI